jgi:small membrane protein
VIIKPLITAILLGILLFAYPHRDAGRILRLGFALAVLAGILFTWSPLLANEIAQWLGVGRGADLIFYLWILISLFILVMVYLKFLRVNRQVTELARAIALLEADRPSDPRGTG